MSTGGAGGNFLFTIFKFPCGVLRTQEQSTHCTAMFYTAAYIQKAEVPGV